MSGTITYKPTTGWYNQNGSPQSSAYHKIGTGGKEMYFTFPNVDTMIPGQDYTPKINKVTLSYYLYAVNGGNITVTVGISNTKSYLKTFDWSTSFESGTSSKKTINYDITNVFTEALQRYGSNSTWYMYFYSGITGKDIEILGSNYTNNTSLVPYITIEWEDGVSPALITSVTSNVLLDNKVYIKFSPLFSTLWYKINITCGSVSFTSEWLQYGSQYTEYEYSYLMSIDKWAKAIPNSYSGTCQVTVSTYTDNVTSALLGSNTSNFTITLQNTNKPTVSLTTELVDGWQSRYIQGESKCTLTAEGSPGAGSTLKSCSISGTDLTTISSTTSPLTKTTSVLNKFGTLTYTAEVSDGRTTVSTTKSIYVYPYSAPIINSFSAERIEDNLTQIIVSYNVSCSDIDGLNKITTLKIYKKESTSSVWESTPIQTIKFSSSQQKTTVSDTMTISTSLTARKSYDFKMEATDTRGKTSSPSSSTTPSEFRIVNINPEKNSLSIGKMCEEENLFDCAIPARFWGALRFGGGEDAGSLRTDTTSDQRNIIYIQTGQAVDGGKTMGLAINNASVYVENEANSGKVNLGNSGRLWNQLYASNSTISTSDRNLKTDITAMSGPQEQLFDKLKPVTYKLKNGTSGRTHYGFVSQDIEDSLTELNLTGKDFAGFCKDLRIDDDGNEVLDESGNKLYNYSLRYSEFIALNTYMIQKLQVENKELKSEIQELKEMIATSSNNVE